jgi:hypothetical protein
MTANVPLQVLIDSGASINVIDEKAYHAITKSPQNNQLSLRHTENLQLRRYFTFTCYWNILNSS